MSRALFAPADAVGRSAAVPRRIGGWSGVSERRATVAVALAAGVTAVAAQLPGALHYAFWQDEVASARILVEGTPVSVLKHVARTESTPPLWYALGWLDHELGASPSDVRLLSVVFGALLAAGTVLLARRLLPLSAAAFAGLLVGLGHQFVLHGAELRAYELYALISLVFPVLLVAFVEAPTKARGALLALVVAAGLLTSYFFGFILAAGTLWLWTSATLRAVRRRVSLVLAAGVVPFFVWLPALAHQYRHQRFAWIGPFSGHRVVAVYWLLLARAEPRTSGLHELVPVLFLALVLAGCVVLIRQSPYGRLCAFLAVVPVGIAGLTWLGGPRIFDTRNVLGVGPFAVVAVAAALARLRRAAAAAAFAAGVTLAIVGYVLAARVPPPAYDRVAGELVAEGWTPRDPIVLYGDFFAARGPLEWYLPHQPRLTLAESRAVACPTIFPASRQSHSMGGSYS